MWIFLCWGRLWLCPQSISKRSITLPSCLHGRETSACSSAGSSGMVVQVLGLNPERSSAFCSGPRAYLGPREGTESPGVFQGWGQAKRTVRGDLIQLFEGQLQRWWDQTLLGRGRWYNTGQCPRIALWEVHIGHQGKLFSREGSAALEQAASGGGKKGNLHPWKALRLSYKYIISHMAFPQ